MRGEINNKKRARQINGFKDLLYGKITPTDIDGLIEYKNKAYIFLEVKYNDADLPFGQRLALERLVKDTSINKKSMVIICEHNVEDPEISVDVSSTKVRELYMYNELKWRKPKIKLTTKQCIDLFINKVVEIK